MGARLVVRFVDGTENEQGDIPRVYLHWGGEYVEEINDTLTAFVASVRELDDTRLTDQIYLAAKLIVWAANKQTTSPYRTKDGTEPVHPLDFLSVGVVTSDDWGDGVVDLICDGSGTWKVTKAIDLDGILA